MSATYKLVRDGVVYELGDDERAAGRLARQFGGRLVIVEAWASENERLVELRSPQQVS